MKFSEPNITSLETKYVMQAMKNGHLSDGVVVKEFEQAFSDRFGYDGSHVIAMNSGTSALHLALIALGVGPGDEVLVTPYTFVASVNVVLAVGATPVFVDVDRCTFNMDPFSAALAVTSKTKACIPVDVFGNPADIIALRKNLPSRVKIVQDSIEAVGTVYGGAPVGAYADVACFGFFPNKQMTTAEGGVLVTQNDEVAHHVRRMVQHGYMEGDEGYKCWGLNLRMTDLQAALGLAQLERWTSIRGALLEAQSKLDKVFMHEKVQYVDMDACVTPFVYVVRKPINRTKEEFMSKMEALGVPIKPYFNSLTKAAHLKQFDQGHTPIADMLGSVTVALPLRHSLTSWEVQTIRNAYTEVA